MESNFGPHRVDLISLATTPDNYDLHNKMPKIFNQKPKRLTLKTFFRGKQVLKTYLFLKSSHILQIVFLKILNTFEKPTTFKKRTPFENKLFLNLNKILKCKHFLKHNFFWNLNKILKCEHLLYNVKKCLCVVKKCVITLAKYTWHVFQKSVCKLKNVEPCKRVFV